MSLGTIIAGLFGGVQAPAAGLTYTPVPVTGGAAAGASAGSLSSKLTGTVSYSVLSGALAVNASTGALTTTGTAPSSGSIAARVIADNGVSISGLAISVPVQVVASNIDGYSLGQTLATGASYCGVAGLLDGFKLTGGDGFNATPTRWSPNDNPGGAYGTSAPQSATLRNGVNDSSMYMPSPYRGSRSQALAPLGFDRVSQSGSNVILTAAPPEAGLLYYLPANTSAYPAGTQGDSQGRPLLIGAQLCSWPSFALSAAGDFVCEGACQSQSGSAVGMWTSIWQSSFNWPDFGEIDWNELNKESDGVTTWPSRNVIVSDTDGQTADYQFLSSTQVGIPDEVMIHWLVKKQAGTISFYDDIATPGTLALRVSTTSNVSRFRGAHDIRLDFSTHPSPTVSNYPRTLKIDFWRCWTPASGPDNQPMQSLGADINTTPGGSWAATLPSMAALYGSANMPDYEEFYGAFDGPDCPGWSGRGTSSRVRLPGGMGIDITNRKLTGTVPTTEGGRVGFIIFGSFNAGGPARRSILYFNIAPAVQNLFGSQSFNYGSAINLSIPFTAFHSGNLGPHAYSVTSDKPWLSAASDGASGVNVTGTAPSSDDVATLTIKATNTKGQATTVTRTITAQNIPAVIPGWTPAQWSALTNWYDPDDSSTVFSNSGGTTAATVDATGSAGLVEYLKDKKGSANLTQGTAANAPAYVTDSLSGRKMVKHTRTVPTRLGASAASLVAGGAGQGSGAYTITAAIRRSNPGVAATPFSFWSPSSTNPAQLVLHQINASDEIAYSRQTTTTNAVSAADASADMAVDAIDIVSWIFSGSTITMRVNGKTVVSAAAASLGTTNVTGYSIGAYYNSANVAINQTMAFGGSHGEHFISTDGSFNSQILSAENYLASKYGVSLTS